MKTQSLIAKFALLLSILFGSIHAETTGYSWSANTAWINWGTSTGDVSFTDKYASGYLYSANLGWINLGDGNPANGEAYQNNSKDDFGVNLEDGGDGYYYLSGYAWSANAGWINFSPSWLPFDDMKARINKTTGVLEGHAYGANIGWLPLRSDGFSEVVIDVHVNAYNEDWLLYR